MPFCTRKLFKIVVFRFNISPSAGVSFQKPSYEVQETNLTNILEISSHKKLWDE